MFEGKKVLIVTPHLSTGGSPQYLLEFLRENKDQFSDFLLVEHSNFSDEFVVQKNKIINLIGKCNHVTLGRYGESEPLYTLNRSKLIDIIDEFKPEVIWMNECPESYEYQLPPENVLDYIYQESRDYKIVETTHYNAFDFSQKRYIPDEFMFCSEKHMMTSSSIDIPKTIWEVPIHIKERPNREKTLTGMGLNPNMLHILNVGLFNGNKNQKYIFDLAKDYLDKDVMFHFVGNSCFFEECGIGDDINLPNCKVWGERDDVDTFMSCMDLYLFPSKKELNPLTVKEALSWDMEVVVNRDDNYVFQYEKLENFYILDEIYIHEFIDTKLNKLFDNIRTINKGSKNIVLYCDEGYHELALNTIESFDRVNDVFTFYYYTVGFEPKISQSNVKVIPINKPIGLPDIMLLKPLVISKTLNLVDDLVYVDCDLIASKHFNYDDFVGKVTNVPHSPLLHDTEWQHPTYYWYDGDTRYEYNESFLMEFLGVKDRTQKWATACMMAVTKNCEKFIDEWVKICFTKELWYPEDTHESLKQKSRKYFHIGDEGPYNVLLWKNNVKCNYTKGIVLEPKEISTILKIENNKVVNQKLEPNNPMTECIDSDIVYAYHQIKDLSFRQQVLNKLRHKQNKFLLVCSFYNNTKEHVENTFVNVLKQTYKNWVLIVGDDFSDDPDFRQYLKNRVVELNDKRIIYYDVKEKRELYLYQNFFQDFDYDYYFDLDADDIIDENILQVYDYHFRKYPNVQSIFSNLSQVNEEGQLLKYYLTQPVDDYVEEFEMRTQTKTDDLWENRVSYSMFGHGRCMRRPEGSGMTIMGNQKTSTDSFFLFYNLNRGDHLNIPRNLYTYVRRDDSDSGFLTDEESRKFNENANYYLNLYKNKTKRGGWVDIYDDIWKETAALSVCDFLNDVDDIVLFSDNICQKEIDELYPDKNITFNDYDGKNVVIVWNNIGGERKEKLLKVINKFNNVTIYYINQDFSIEEDLHDVLSKEKQKVLNDVSKHLTDYSWFDFFRHLVITKKAKVDNNVIDITYNNGVKVEVRGEYQKTYNVRFINDENGELIYQSNIENNMWVSPSPKYYVKWRVEVIDESGIIKSDVLNLEGKKVFIHFHSSSLGDSLAWIPYVEEFRKKHNCEVYCQTHKTFLYEKSYPHIHFDVKKMGVPHASYIMGWFYDDTLNKNDVRTIPLQQTATDILGLDYKEIVADIDYTSDDKKINGKYVTLSTQSTAQCKYWNKKGGWNNVVKFLKKQGYRVICIDQHKSFGTDKFMNTIPSKCEDYTGRGLDEVMNLIYHAEFHIGISSGLSWLSWAMKKPTVMVSSFSKPFCEFNTNCYRVYKDSIKSGYFNDDRYRFKQDEWSWNPIVKCDTLDDWDRFEPITTDDVLEKVKELLDS